MPQPSPLLSALRWITLAAIAGTVVAMGVDLASIRGPWLLIGLALGVLSFVCCAIALTLLNRAIDAAAIHARKASDEAQKASHEVDEQSARFDSMRSQLEEYRRLQDELTAAKQAAEQAAMAKSEFLATMSHEVRTPLNGIVPMLELLQSSKLAQDQREMLGTALQSARQLLRIVDDILDYSKLEAHKLQLESVSLNLRETLDSVIRLLERQAQAKGLRLSLHMDTDVRAVFRGDPVRMRQIVSNLVSNALKFTERGTISVHVAKLRGSRTHEQLRFEIRDTGVGISPEAAGKLFSAFSQADASTTRVYGGTGLGLAICKRIVDLMGGRIGVESEVGRGSTFWFEIPMLKAAGDIEGPRTGLQGARLLVLTSDMALFKRIGSSLAQTGAKLTMAENTQDALVQLRAAGASASRGLDIFIVDSASIKHTIVALHRNLAAMSESERMRLLFLEGADSLPEDVRKLPGAVVVQRTLAETDLRPKLAELMAGEAISTAGAESQASVSVIAGEQHAPPVRQDTPPIASQGSANAFVHASAGPIRGRLLLVEDNPVNLLVAQRLISLLGPQCETAENGAQALEKLARGHFDIVLMDCQMPIMDGYTATRTWRAQEAEHQRKPLPIIAMTANAMAGDRQKCLDAGMDDYLSKPVARDQLEATLRRWLEAQTLQRPIPAPDPVLPTQRPASPARESEPAKSADHSAITAEELALAGRKLEEATAAFAAEQAALESPTVNNSPDNARLAAPKPAPAPAATTAEPPVSHPVATPDTGSSTPSAPPVRTPPPALDVEIIEDLWGAMGDSFAELVHVFLEDAPIHLAKLDAALASNDTNGLIGPAHALKSSSANLGALQLSAAAKHVEHGARAGSLTQPHLAVKVLHYEFKRVEAELHNLLA